MRTSPSIVPNDNDETVYLVADDFGRLGRAWREADYEATDLETVIQDLLTGQYSHPPSISPSAGRKTFPKTLPANCAVGAICRCAIFPLRSLILSNATRIAIGFS